MDDIVNPKMVQSLGATLEISLEGEYSTRLVAEDVLSEAVDAPDYALALLAVVASHGSDDVRLEAVERFNKLLSCRWPKNGGSEDHLPDLDRLIVKKSILRVLRQATDPSLAGEVSEAIALIARYDFPSEWEGVLESIVSDIQSATLSKGEFHNWDLDDTKLLLVAASAILSSLRYRNLSTAQDPTMLVYGHVLQHCTDLLVTPLKALITKLQAAVLKSDPTNDLVVCLEMCFKVLEALNCDVMHHLFGDEIDTWIGWFNSILYATHLRLMADADDLCAVSCVNLQLCLVKHKIPDTSAVAAIQDFVTNHLEPLFHGPDWSSLPLLMAGTLRSLVVFKDELTKDTALKLLRRAANFLQHDSDVVRFYAASFVKDLLSKNSGASNMAIVAASDLNNSDTINVLMKNLIIGSASVTLEDQFLISIVDVVLGNVNKRDRRQSLEAMVLVLRGAMKRIPYRLYEQNKLKEILSVAAELCAASTTHHAGFQIFNSSIEMDTSLVTAVACSNLFLEHKDIWEDPVWFGELLDQIVDMFSSSQVGAQGMQVATEQELVADPASLFLLSHGIDSRSSL
ncbi:hypothetical protein PR202_gb27259 [Eleusine coracana subsp. coracana]|uniref:Importin N-terminal domain-containing protein n=1 Tax=Eleusine coracana subsp. coracana TaxID=191504 RepID=A0AAV5FUJ3_ELECO|nr:hypothetical protein PR202_gb27259 [Eleusine coracana subsp. coracana]